MNEDHLQLIDNQQKTAFYIVMSNFSNKSEKRPKTGKKASFPFIFRKFSVFLIVLLSFMGQGAAQVEEQEFLLITETIRSILEDFIENTDGNAEFDFNTISEDLYELYELKIDLNESQYEDLQPLIFLSDDDIRNIIAYRDQYGPLLSPYEVQAIPSLSTDKARLLLAFIKIEKDILPAIPYKIKLLQKSKNDLFLKTRRTFEQREGYSSENGGDPDYRGHPNYLYLRYVHSDIEKRKWGLTIEKDAGETFINSNSFTGIDYISGYYENKDISPRIKQINIGDFNVNLGQGLVAHSAFGVGKSSFTTNVVKGGQKLKSFSSVIENIAHRGGAILLTPSPNIEFLTFASYDRRDGNIQLSEQIDQETFVTSLQTSGLHRTASEIEDQDAIGHTTLGAHVGWANKNYTLGLNTVFHQYDKELIRANTPYRLYQWQGTSLSNHSLDYKAAIGGWNLFGEVAYSSTGGWAVINGIIKSLDRDFDVAAIYRNYSPTYQALNSNAFGESALSTNEKGLYLGMQYRPSSTISIGGYVDFWQNPWLRSRVDGPGYGNEYLLRVDFKPSKRKSFYFLYRYERKSENAAVESDIDIPIDKTTQRLRFHIQLKPSKNITLRSRIEGSLFFKENKTDRGILIYQDLIYNAIDKPYSTSMRLSYFDISNFNARIYAYENDLLYEYYIPAFSGNGLRYYIKGKYKINRSLLFELRLDQTRYFDRDLIGSGRDEIKGNTITGIKAQIKWRF